MMLPRRTRLALTLVVRFELERRMLNIESLAQSQFELLLDDRPSFELRRFDDDMGLQRR